MPYSKLTDAELVVLLRNQNRSAFSEIFNRYWGQLYVHALKMLKDEDDAKDIVQEVFTALWLKSEKIEIILNLQAYLFSCIRFKVLNHIRDNNTRINYIDLFSQFINRKNHTVLEHIEERELAEAINAVINSLPEKMKKIFELSRTQYLSHKEISKKLNISEKTVKKQISNALYILKGKINPENLLLVLFLSRIK
jgi:RNA polymerase sigma-70 factor (family 1)